MLWMNGTTISTTTYDRFPFLSGFDANGPTAGGTSLALCPPPHLEVVLADVLEVLQGTVVGLLEVLLPPLVLRLQLVQLHAQVLPLLAELVLQLLQ